MCPKLFLALFLFLSLGSGLEAQASAKLIPYRSGELWGYCSPDKKMRIQPQYERAGWFYDGLALVAQGCDMDCYDMYDGKWGFINLKGQVVIPFEYERALRFHQGKAYALKDGVWYEFNTKGQRVRQLEQEPDFTEQPFEKHLEEYEPKGFYPEYTKAEWPQLIGYTSKKGLEYWDDPENLIFLPVHSISQRKGGSFEVLLPEYPYEQHKEALGTALKPSLILISQDKGLVKAEQTHEIKYLGLVGEGKLKFHAFDLSAEIGMGDLRAHLEQIQPESKPQRLMFGFSCKIPSPALMQSTLFNIYRMGIQFTDVEEDRDFLWYHTSLYEWIKPWHQNHVLKNMLEDIHFTGQALKEQGDGQNQRIVGANNPYAGRMLFDLMAEAKTEDLQAFLRYVEARPFIYMAGRWKIAEVFATWVVEGAPRVIEKK